MKFVARFEARTMKRGIHANTRASAGASNKAANRKGAV